MSNKILPLQGSVITIHTYVDGRFDAIITTMGDVNVPQMIAVLEKEIESLRLLISDGSNPISSKLDISFSGKIQI